MNKRRTFYRNDKSNSLSSVDNSKSNDKDKVSIINFDLHEVMDGHEKSQSIDSKRKHNPKISNSRSHVVLKNQK